MKLKWKDELMKRVVLAYFSPTHTTQIEKFSIKLSKIPDKAPEIFM